MTRSSLLSDVSMLRESSFLASLAVLRTFAFLGMARVPFDRAQAHGGSPALTRAKAHGLHLASTATSATSCARRATGPALCPASRRCPLSLADSCLPCPPDHLHLFAQSSGTADQKGHSGPQNYPGTQSSRSPGTEKSAASPWGSSTSCHHQGWHLGDRSRILTDQWFDLNNSYSCSAHFNGKIHQLTVQIYAISNVTHPSVSLILLLKSESTAFTYFLETEPSASLIHFVKSIFRLQKSKFSKGASKINH